MDGQKTTICGVKCRQNTVRREPLIMMSGRAQRRLLAVQVLLRWARQRRGARDFVEDGSILAKFT
jgi:hypothetical protein